MEHVVSLQQTDREFLTLAGFFENLDLFVFIGAKSILQSVALQACKLLTMPICRIMP